MKDNDTIDSLTVHCAPTREGVALDTLFMFELMFSCSTWCKGDTVLIWQDNQLSTHKNTIPTVGLVRQCNMMRIFLLGIMRKFHSAPWIRTIETTINLCTIESDHASYLQSIAFAEEYRHRTFRTRRFKNLNCKEAALFVQVTLFVFCI